MIANDSSYLVIVPIPSQIVTPINPIDLSASSYHQIVQESDFQTFGLFNKRLFINYVIIFRGSRHPMAPLVIMSSLGYP